MPKVSYWMKAATDLIQSRLATKNTERKEKIEYKDNSMQTNSYEGGSSSQGSRNFTKQDIKHMEDFEKE